MRDRIRNKVDENQNIQGEYKDRILSIAGELDVYRAYADDFEELRLYRTAIDWHEKNFIKILNSIKSNEAVNLKIEDLKKELKLVKFIVDSNLPKIATPVIRNENHHKGLGSIENDIFRDELKDLREKVEAINQHEFTRERKYLGTMELSQGVLSASRILSEQSNVHGVKAEGGVVAGEKINGFKDKMHRSESNIIFKKMISLLLT